MECSSLILHLYFYLLLPRLTSLQITDSQIVSFPTGRDASNTHVGGQRKEIKDSSFRKWNSVRNLKRKAFKASSLSPRRYCFHRLVTTDKCPTRETSSRYSIYDLLLVLLCPLFPRAPRASRLEGRGIYLTNKSFNVLTDCTRL